MRTIVLACIRLPMQLLILLALHKQTILNFLYHTIFSPNSSTVIGEPVNAWPKTNQSSIRSKTPISTYTSSTACQRDRKKKLWTETLDQSAVQRKVGFTTIASKATRNRAHSHNYNNSLQQLLQIQPKPLQLTTTSTTKTRNF